MKPTWNEESSFMQSTPGLAAALQIATVQLWSHYTKNINVTKILTSIMDADNQLEQLLNTYNSKSIIQEK